MLSIDAVSRWCNWLESNVHIAAERQCGSLTLSTRSVSFQIAYCKRCFAQELDYYSVSKTQRNTFSQCDLLCLLRLPVQLDKRKPSRQELSVSTIGADAIDEIYEPRRMIISIIEKKPQLWAYVIRNSLGSNCCGFLVAHNFGRFFFYVSSSTL